MCPGYCQGRWHSIWCCLHTGWRHHWTLWWGGTDTPKVCFSSWQWNQSFYFGSSEEMLATAHRVTKATAWHGEPIRLHTSPSTAHLRAYMARRNGWPWGSQSLTPYGEEVLQLPLVTPHPDGRIHTNSTWDLRDAQLRQLKENLQQDIAHRELNEPPGAHPWRTLAGDRDPNMNDEVTLPGREGMGTQRTATSTMRRSPPLPQG